VIPSARQSRPAPPSISYVSSSGVTTVLASGQLCPTTVTRFLDGVLGALDEVTEPVLMDATDLVFVGPVAANAITFLHRAAASRGIDFAVVGMDPALWFGVPVGDPIRAS
jgi:anti-anti-sigma regulatory factor